MRDITKRFAHVTANESVSISFGAGEILALVGENGAGKTTLMSILYGIHAPDSGQIVLDGAPVEFHSTADAIDHGLGMVSQHFQLFPGLSVAENVVYGAEPSDRSGLLRRRSAERAVADLATRHGLAVPAAKAIDDLPVGVLQRVEILKMLYRGAEVLILDEPTGVLTPQESRGLFTVLRQLADQGRAIVLITHKLDEVVAVADQVVVLRDGRTVFEAPVSTTSATELANHMTGRDVNLQPRRAITPPGREVLAVRHANTSDGRGALRDVSISVRAGEIVGVAGVAGNGQETLAAAIAGHTPLTSGDIAVVGVDVTETDNNRRRGLGLAHIPEDRNRDGVAQDADVTTNLAAGFHRQKPLTVRGILRPKAFRNHAEQLVSRFAIKTADHTAAVRTLSGGNTQKLLVARELAHDSPFLLAEQPTRGVDLGAVEFIYEQLDDYRRRGGAVLLISSELTELLTLSDRIVVMLNGRLVAESSAAETTHERLGELMAGSTDALTAGTR